ncbi:hypothetical protein EOL96_05720 [Candidatus Saccharibacteria bacterium]|nr:hypothetical protein [Candidatus Saccharibacteria bacterium]
MKSEKYTLELTTLFDSNADVTFRIKPIIEFLTEEARISFGENVLDLIARRADYGELKDMKCKVEVTHKSADGTASLGYARVPALRYGTGEEVFRQAMLTALNGEIPQLYS